MQQWLENKKHKACARQARERIADRHRRGLRRLVGVVGAVTPILRECDPKCDFHEGMRGTIVEISSWRIAHVQWEGWDQLDYRDLDWLMQVKPKQ